MTRVVCAAVMLIGSVAPALAQMIPLRVHHTGSNAVAQQVASGVQAELAASTRYILQRPGDLTGAEIRIASADGGSHAGGTDASAIAVLFRVSWVCGAETRPVDENPKLQVKIVRPDEARAVASALLTEYEAWVAQAQPTACGVVMVGGKKSEQAGAVWFVSRMEK